MIKFMEKFPDQMSRADEVEAIRRGQAGCTKSRNAVIMTVGAMVWKLASRWGAGHDAEILDLWQSGMGILVDKFDQFDLSRGVRFSTWAHSWMRCGMQRYQQHHGQLIRVPTNAGRIPEGDYRWEDLRRAREVLPMSWTGEDAKGDETTVPSAADWREMAPGQAFDLETKAGLVREVLGKMQPRQRTVLLMNLDGATNPEIGDVLGVSRERVRQIAACAREAFILEAKRTNRQLVREIEEELRDGLRNIKPWAMPRVRRKEARGGSRQAGKQVQDAAPV